MLKKLVIKNVALIDCVEIDFESGLNVLSGETGAGKSVIIDSLNFVLGAKPEKSMIRTGENECLVKAEFDVYNNQAVSAILSELDIENEDILLISRKYNLDGRSSAKINGNTVTATMLKKLTSTLLDVHGQSEHFYLLSTANQLSLIDKFGGDSILSIKNQIKSEYNEYKNTIRELDKMGGDENQRLIRLDVLNYQINEISSADIKENEEEELLALRDKLRNQEKIISTLSAIKSSISDEGGVDDILSNANRVLSSITNYGDNYSKLYDRLYSAYSEIIDINDEVNGLVDEFDYLELNPDEIEDRISLIKSLKKKYGNTFEEINDYLTKSIEEKNKLENYNELTEELIIKKSQQEKALFDYYNNLSDLRRNFAREFTNNVLGELKELKMDKSQFNVKFNDKPSKESCAFDSSNGFDEIEFEFSANLGEPLKPMSKVISGGEMSRFMLAIKAQTARYNDINTFIFDEIDAGISGVVAKVVAEKFAKISKSVQIIAISHLPQICAMADNNLFIKKTEKENSTITSVSRLDYQQKINEITRLVGGDSDSVSAKNHAEELIKQADNYKMTV